MRDHIYFVYMLASGHYGTLYVGVTNDLVRRVGEHREGSVPGFTRRYGIGRLVWYERHADIHEAIAREKKIEALAARLEDRAYRRGRPALD